MVLSHLLGNKKARATIKTLGVALPTPDTLFSQCGGRCLRISVYGLTPEYFQVCPSWDKLGRLEEEQQDKEDEEEDNEVLVLGDATKILLTGHQLLLDLVCVSPFIRIRGKSKRMFKIT